MYLSPCWVAVCHKEPLSQLHSLYFLSFCTKFANPNKDARCDCVQDVAVLKHSSFTHNHSMKLAYVQQSRFCIPFQKHALTLS